MILENKKVPDLDIFRVLSAEELAKVKPLTYKEIEAAMEEGRIAYEAELTWELGRGFIDPKVRFTKK